MRNLIAHAPLRMRAEVAQAAKRVLQAPDRAEAKRRLDEFSGTFARSAPKTVACLEAGIDDAMAVMALPEKYRRRLKTTNMQERLGRGNSPPRARDPPSSRTTTPRCVWFGALLAEQKEVWQERKYLDMDEFAEWAASRAVSAEDHNIVALSS